MDVKIKKALRFSSLKMIWKVIIHIVGFNVKVKNYDFLKIGFEYSD